MSQPQDSKVPKFASFKPKVKAAAAHESASNGKREAKGSRLLEIDCINADHVATHENRSRRDRRERHKRDVAEPVSRHYDLHADKVPGSRRASAREDHSQREARPLPIVSELEESNTYTVDRRGDIKNVEYGSLHRYNVPTHYRTGYGRVIGLPFARIDRDESSEKIVVLDHINKRRHEREGRLLSSKIVIQPNERKLRLISASTGSAELDPSDEFVPLKSLKRKLGSESPENMSKSAQQVDYRSIEGKAKSDIGPKDTDLEYATDTDEELAFDQVGVEIRSKSVALSRRTKDHPNDAEAWLDLVHHQAEVIKPGIGLQALNHTERRSLADIRLSIYDQALKTIQNDASDYDRLILGQLTEGAVRWDNTKLESRWQEALQQSPTSVLLWTKYLTYIQASPIGFKYERCREAYLRCLQVLRTALSKASSAQRLDIQYSQLYILLHFTCFTRDAGYGELANAMWQAVLEYHFNAPSILANAGPRLEAFAEFWDDEYPRIGEASAVGWAQAVREQGKGVRQQTATTSLQGETKRRLRHFADQESNMLAQLHLSAPTEDESEEDPYRYVMSSDLQEVIQLLQAELPKHALINAFLFYMHLPVIPRGLDDAVYSWRTDEFLRTNVKQPETNGPTERKRATHCTVDNVLPTTFALFATAFASCPSVFCEDDLGSSEAMRFVERALELLARVMPDDEALTEYLVAFKLHFDPSDVFTFTKSVLKSRSTSIRLYNAYALAEAYKENLNKARKVWLSAAGLAQNLEDGVWNDKMMLWHSWIKTELVLGNNSASLRCLLSMCGDTSRTDIHDDNLAITAAQKLRFSSFIRNRVGRFIDNDQGDYAVLCFECHMYFAYITERLNLDPVLEVCAMYEIREDLNQAALETLHQAKVELMRLHIEQKRPYKPAQIRAALVKGTKLFSSNSASFELLGAIDAHYPITDRIREAAANQTVHQPDLTMVSWSYMIAREIQRCQKAEASGSTQHSVRKLFLRALQVPSSTMKHSVVLWKMWFDFEKTITDGNVHRRLRQVFLEGLRCLPWCKAWVIHGLQYLAQDGVTSDAELRQIHDVLVERGLRIRVDIDAN